MEITTRPPADAAFVVRADPKAQAKVYGAMGIVGGLVLLGGLVSLAFDWKSPIAWGLTVVGLATLAHTLIDYRRQTTFPVLAVTPSHIWFRIGAKHLAGIPWDDVTDVRTTTHGGYWFVLVDADEAAARLAENSTLWQRTSPARQAHGTPFALTDGGKDKSRWQIIAGINASRPGHDESDGNPIDDTTGL